jgi:hypothetical protein
MSFITLVGTYTADAPLTLPRQVVLILNGALITASNNFPGNALGLIIANGAHFSAVVSPGGPASAVLDCGDTTGPAGIYVYNSSYFNIDGITVKNCGASSGAITLVGTTDRTRGNSTSVLNSVITQAKGNGILISQACRPVIYNTRIVNSVGAGVYVSTTFGTILSENTITGNGAHGVYFGLGSTQFVARGNLISSNYGSGLTYTNAAGYPKVSNSIILGNQILSNGLYSIELAVDSSSQISNTVILGNTINGNAQGLNVKDLVGTGITKTYLGQNDDSDGLMSSFLALTNGNAASRCSGNFFLDPLNRGVRFASQLPSSPLGSTVIAYRTNT